MTNLPFEPSECLALVDMVRNQSRSVDKTAKAKPSPITRPTNTEIRMLRIEDIDLSLQVRVETDERTVAEYALHLKEGGTLARPLVFIDSDKKWGADGTHTVLAYKANGSKEIECDVIEGSKLDARLVACVANAGHGKSLSQADRRKIVHILFAEKPETLTWSTREISRHLRKAASHTTVGEVKKELEAKRTGTAVNPGSSKGQAKARAPKVEPVIETIEADEKAMESFLAPGPTDAPPDDAPVISVAEKIDIERIAEESLDAEDDMAEVEAEQEEPEPPPSDPVDDNELIEGIDARAWKVSIVDDDLSLYVETHAGTTVLVTAKITRRDVARASTPLAAE